LLKAFAIACGEGFKEDFDSKQSFFTVGVVGIFEKRLPPTEAQYCFIS
jgi:hypothetical protein